MEDLMLMAMLAVVLSVELVLVLAALLGHVPVTPDISFVHSVIWHYQRNIQPQRNLFFYFLWMGSKSPFMPFMVSGEVWQTGIKNNLKTILGIPCPGCLLDVPCRFCRLGHGQSHMGMAAFLGSIHSGLIASVFWPEFPTVLQY